MADNGYFLVTEHQIQTRQNPNRKRRILPSLLEIKSRLPSFYFLLLGLRFLLFIFYTIHASDCFFRKKHASYFCVNSTLMPYPLELELSWQVTLIINCLLCIVVLPQMPTFQGYRATFNRLSRFSHFWSLQGQLFITIVYTVFMFALADSSYGATTVAIQVAFIVGSIFSTMVACLWNFVPYPTKHILNHQIYLAYRSTTFLFYIENFYLFVLVSAHIAFQIHGVHGDELKSRHPSVKAAITLVHAGEVSYYYVMSKFFWNKLFDDKRNLLEADHL